MNLTSLFNLGNASLSPTTKYGTMVFLLVILLLSLFLGTYIGPLSPVREGNETMSGSAPPATTKPAPTSASAVGGTPTTKPAPTTNPVVPSPTTHK